MPQNKSSVKGGSISGEGPNIGSVTVESVLSQIVSTLRTVVTDH